MFSKIKQLYLGENYNSNQQSLLVTEEKEVKSTTQNNSQDIINYIHSDSQDIINYVQSLPEIEHSISDTVSVATSGLSGENRTLLC